MKNIKGILIFTIAACALAIGCKNKENRLQMPTATTDSVAAFILKKETFNKEVSFPGEFLPLEKAEIYTKVPGYIKTLKVDIGDWVQEGQVLAVLEAPEIIANYAQNHSDVQTARSKYMGSLDAYNRTLNAAKVEGTIAAGEIERIKSQMLADSATLEAAKYRLNAYAQLKNYLIIRAPFSGIVTQRNVDPGTLVGTGNTNPILIVENNSILRLRLPVPEAYVSANVEGASVKFTVDAYPDVLFKAKLSRKSGALNLTNRTEIWEFLYVNKENQLKPGMFANAILTFYRSTPSFMVPSTAIVTNQEKRFVIQLKDGKTEWVEVRNGISVGNKTEIFGNLSEGDTLLVNGTDQINTGINLNPKFQ